MFSFPEWKIDHDIRNQHAIIRGNCTEMIDMVFSKDPILKSFIINSWLCDGFIVIDIGNLQSIDPFIYKEKDFSHILTYNSHLDGWFIKHEDDVMLYEHVTFNNNSFSSTIPAYQELSTKDWLLRELKSHQTNKSNLTKLLQSYKKDSFNSASVHRTESCISELDDRIEKLNMVIKISNKELVYDDNLKFFIDKSKQGVIT